MAVASRSFQPSRIGFGAVKRPPLPAGRTWKYMCDAFVELGAAIRPSTVPPMTCEPFFRRVRRIRFGSKRTGRDDTLSNVEEAPFFARESRTCSRPPACFAFGRVGCAKRRSRSTACAGAGAESSAATRVFLAFAATRFLATVFAVGAFTWRPALAGAVGFGSLFFCLRFAWIALAVV